MHKCVYIILMCRCAGNEHSELWLQHLMMMFFVIFFMWLKTMFIDYVRMFWQNRS